MAINKNKDLFKGLLGRELFGEGDFGEDGKFFKVNTFIPAAKIEEVAEVTIEGRDTDFGVVADSTDFDTG